MAVEFPQVEVVVDLAGATSQDWDVIAVPIAPGPHDDAEGAQPRAGVLEAAALYGIDLADLADVNTVSGKAGQTAVILVPRLLRQDTPWAERPRRIVLLGIGDAGPTAMRAAGAALARACASFGRVLTTAPSAASSAEAITAFVEGALLAAHAGVSAKSVPPTRLTRLGLVPLAPLAADALEAPIARASVLAEGTGLARRLTATRAATATTTWLAEQAVQAGADVPGVKVTVHDERWLARNGFGGVLAVGAGGEPPRLVVARYTPSARGARGDRAVRTVVVVGKGITYDTGGLAIKPREAMASMHTDMAGSAVALATVLTAARLRLPHEVIGVMALAENTFGGQSYRPGDVLRTVDGTTVEVGNTDAEGRLVLADALAWARRELAPDLLVDVATLTGAAKLALGTGIAAVYAAPAGLTEAMVAAGEASGERVWPMPLVSDYAEALASDVADLSHIATDPKVTAGSITAALFLQHFAGDTPWLHLDIAGPARSAKAAGELPEGATGFGVRLLTRWLEALAS